MLEHQMMNKIVSLLNLETLHYQIEPRVVYNTSWYCWE